MTEPENAEDYQKIVASVVRQASFAAQGNFGYHQVHVTEAVDRAIESGIDADDIIGYVPHFCDKVGLDSVVQEQIRASLQQALPRDI